MDVIEAALLRYIDDSKVTNHALLALNAQCIDDSECINPLAANHRYHPCLLGSGRQIIGAQ